VLLMAFAYFLVCSGGYGYLFWLPSVFKTVSKASDLGVAFLFVIPYLLSAAGMVLISRDSDRRRERRIHVALPLALGGFFFFAAVYVGNRAALASYAFICLVGPGIYGMLGPFWAIPSEVFPRSVAGSAMGLINAIGALGGYFGPLAVGYSAQRTGNFAYAFCILGAALLTSAALMLLFRCSSVNAECVGSRSAHFQVSK